MWNGYQAVLWDFDGVIVDTEWPIYQAWLATYEREGAARHLPPEVYVQCIGSDFETWSPETLLEEKTGKNFDWAQEGIERNQDIRRRLQGAQALPGIQEAMELIRAAGAKQAVVSSSTHSWVMRHALNLRPIFT